jgi:hypothetical protein
MAYRSIAGIYRFYHDGFRSMTVGKTLWKIILIKLFVMFAVLKLFFFQDFLQSNFTTDEERADHVFEQITEPARNTLQAGTNRTIEMPDRH